MLSCAAEVNLSLFVVVQELLWPVVVGREGWWLICVLFLQSGMYYFCNTPYISEVVMTVRLKICVPFDLLVIIYHYYLPSDPKVRIL